MNLDLSARRLERVKTILSQFAGNRMVFEFKANGEFKAQTPESVESDKEHTVVVSVMEETRH
jgi:uncharacterized protein YecE (DUF72 family)